MFEYGGRADLPYWAWQGGPAGVRDLGIDARGLPGNLGDPTAPSRNTGVERPDRNAPGSQVGVGPDERDEDRRTGGYRRPKDNEGRREGWSGVGHLHSTVEAGEPTPRGPWGGKGGVGSGAVSGNLCGGLPSEWESP